MARPKQMSRTIVADRETFEIATSVMRTAAKGFDRAIADSEARRRQRADGAVIDAAETADQTIEENWRQNAIRLRSFIAALAV